MVSKWVIAYLSRGYIGVVMIHLLTTYLPTSWDIQDICWVLELCHSPRCCLAISKYCSASGFLIGSNQAQILRNRKIQWVVIQNPILGRLITDGKAKIIVNYKWIQPKFDLLMRKNTWYGEICLKRLFFNHTNFLTGSSPSFIIPHTHTLTRTVKLSFKSSHIGWRLAYENLIHVTTNQLHIYVWSCQKALKHWWLATPLSLVLPSLHGS